MLAGLYVKTGAVKRTEDFAPPYAARGERARCMAAEIFDAVMLAVQIDEDHVAAVDGVDGTFSGC